MPDHLDSPYDNLQKKYHHCFSVMRQKRVLNI